MTTNKPEVFEVYRTKQGTLENMVLLSDYESLQAECELWKNSASGAHQQLTANRIETEKLAIDWSKAMTECERLRKDAERYRWLRDKSESLHSFYLSTPIWMTGVRFRPENVDSTIDSAMEGATSEGS